MLEGHGAAGGAQVLNPDPTDPGLSAACRKTSREAAPRRASLVCSQHKEFFMMAAMPGKPLRRFFRDCNREKKTAASGFWGWAEIPRCPNHGGARSGVPCHPLGGGGDTSLTGGDTTVGASWGAPHKAQDREFGAGLIRPPIPQGWRPRGPRPPRLAGEVPAARPQPQPGRAARESPAHDEQAALPQQPSHAGPPQRVHLPPQRRLPQHHHQRKAAGGGSGAPPFPLSTAAGVAPRLFGQLSSCFCF